MFRSIIAVLNLLLVVHSMGCASYLSIPDQHPVVSNHQAEVIAGDNYCIPRDNRPGSEQNRQESTLNAEGFSLLNWNVLKGSRENWQRDFKRLSRDSDIVALQEAHLHEDFNEELEQSAFFWDLSTAFYLEGNETGVLTGSSAKPVSTCFLFEPEPLIILPKSALVTEYGLRGSSEMLLVANIHMVNFSTSTASYRKQLEALIARLEQHHGPMIVTGDFNTWSNGRMHLMQAMADRLELEAVEFKKDHRLTIFGSPLDHIYYRGLIAMDASTEYVETSDHNPLRVRFRLSSL